MSRGSREDGAKARRAILAELVRRWENMEPELSFAGLAERLGMSETNARHHIRQLREMRYVHPSGLVCTPLGYREIRRDGGLTT